MRGLTRARATNLDAQAKVILGFQPWVSSMRAAFGRVSSRAPQLVREVALLFYEYLGEADHSFVFVASSRRSRQRPGGGSGGSRCSSRGARRDIRDSPSTTRTSPAPIGRSGSSDRGRSRDKFEASGTPS